VNDANDARLLDTAGLRAMLDFGDPAGSEARFRARLAEAAPGSVAAAELATQVARAQGLQGRFQEADVTLDTIRSEHPVVLARLELERGRVRNSSGDPVTATSHFHRALTHSDDAGSDFLAVDALHMLAIADSANAAAWSRQGIERAGASSDPLTRSWLGSLHNNLGWTHHDAGGYQTALVQFEAALAAFEENGTLFQIHVAHWTVARCLRSLGRLDEALAIQRRLGTEDDPDSYVDEEIAILQELLASPLSPES
jgi:tetratricopeptide (TPR) repeat protein